MDSSFRRIDRTRWVVALLGGYVVLQFAWWAYSLRNLSAELRDARSTLNPDSTFPDAEYTKRLWMIFGEGTIFLALLMLGWWYVLYYLRRERRFQERQTRFLAHFTHEIKTPIAGIRLALQTLSRRVSLPEDIAPALSGAEEQTRYLERLTEKILQSNRLAHGQQFWAAEPVNLNDVVDRVVNRYRKLPGYETRVLWQGADEQWTKGDALALESVVDNLLENGLKYSAEKDPVGLELSASERFVELVVSDQGRGIPSEEKQRVFNRFYQVPSTSESSRKGAGLGLYLVQGLVQLHRGAIEVKDRDGGGTVFHIRLPLYTPQS